MASSYVTGGFRARTDNENVQQRVKGKAAVESSSKTSRSALGTIGSQINVNNGTRGRLESHNGVAERKAVSKSKALSQLSLKDKDSQSSTQPTSDSTYNPYGSDIIEAPVRPAHIPDIDTDDSDNPQLVSEYINEIYVYLRRVECLQSVRPDYMKGYEITPRMRTVLIDWLVQVHQRFRLLQETLYLTIAIIDRFLQDGEVSKGKLQLVGVAAMWIASKYEEMYAPEIGDFVYITDNAYTKSNIRQMERTMLKRLKFELGRPLPLHFLRRYSKAGEVDSTRHSLAKYLLELSILDYKLVHVPPSHVSAACLCMSVRLLGDDDGELDDRQEEEEAYWGDSLRYYSTYSEEQLMPVMHRLALLISKSYASKHQAIRLKYQSSKFMRISTIEELQSAVIDDWAEKAQLAEEDNSGP